MNADAVQLWPPSHTSQAIASSILRYEEMKMDSGIGLNVLHTHERMVKDGLLMQFHGHIFSRKPVIQETTDF
jgi:hypothetical protein